MSLRNLVAELKRVEALGERVYPVVCPADERSWPVCVVAMDGGAELGVLGEGAGAKVQAIRIGVLDDDYQRLVGVMGEIQARVDRLAYSLIDPPDDVWNDTLGTVQQTIRVSLLP